MEEVKSNRSTTQRFWSGKRTEKCLGVLETNRLTELVYAGAYWTSRGPSVALRSPPRAEPSRPPEESNVGLIPSKKISLDQRTKQKEKRSSRRLEDGV